MKQSNRCKKRRKRLSGVFYRHFYRYFCNRGTDTFQTVLFLERKVAGYRRRKRLYVR